MARIAIRNMNSFEPEFVARCLRGLEWIVAAEIDHSGGVPTTSGHRTVRFLLAEPTEERLRLRVADDVFLVVGEVPRIGRVRSALAELRNGVLKLQWQLTADVLRNVVPQRSWHRLAVVASFLGRRNYNRFEVEEAVGVPLESVLGVPFVRANDLLEARDTLTVRVHIVDDQALIALRVFETPLHRRAYKTNSSSGTLHPPLACAMGMLAGVRGGMSMLDPFCGSGTIPIEAKLTEPQLNAVGAEIDAKTLAIARDNGTAAIVDVKWLQLDVAQLRGSRSVTYDRIVTNPPWGRAVAPGGALTGLDVTMALALLEPLLSKGGRVVVLLDSEEPMRLSPRLRPQFEQQVSVFGRHPRLSVFSDAPAFSAPFDLTSPFGAELDRYKSYSIEKVNVSPSF